MRDEPPPNKEVFGPLALPVAIISALLGVIGLFKSNAEVLGWQIVAAVGFLVSIGWSVWYLFAKTTVASSVAGAAPRRVLLHPSRWRFTALLLPATIIVAVTVVFTLNREPDYAQLLVGGGPYSPVVVFDSKPRGAKVKVAWIIDADDDPLLENKKGSDKVIEAGSTLCRIRISQGQYWAVFQLSGRTVTGPFTALGPTVVRADFHRSKIDVLHP